MYQISEIAQVLDSAIQADHSLNMRISDFHVDSRKVLHPDSTLFFCLSGHRSDGHQYISQLYEKGVRCFVVSQDIKPLPNAVFFQVENVLDSLQKMAGYHRQQMKTQIIGITGSNGKTTIKEWLAELLSSKFVVHKSPGSYNSQIGVPLSLLSIRPKHEISIIEVGISQPGEMDKMRQIVQPDMGILTMIGSAHDAGFENRDQKLREKSSLFEHSQFWMSRAKYAQYHIDNHQSSDENPHETSISTVQKDIASAENLNLILSFIKFQFPDFWKEVRNEKILLTTIELRTDMKNGIRNNTIICDYYNSDLESLQNTLQWSDNLDKSRPKTLILSELEEQKDVERTSHQLTEIIEKFDVSHLIWVGNNPPNFKGDYHIYQNTHELIKSRFLQDLRDQTIIIKGARKHKFEQIERLLVQPIIGTSLTVDMESLLHNWNTMKSLLQPDVKKLIMIKAAAYGTGLVDIARFFEEHKADYLGVAYANEGILLREKGIQMPILMLNANPMVWEMMLSHQLEPVIHSVEQLRQYSSLVPNDQVLRCHINLNTGMNRLGIDGDEINQLIEILDENSNLEICSLMTHLAAAEKIDAKNFTLRQVRDFRAWSNSIKQELSIDPFLHVLNSSGVINYPDQQLDMVRFGIAVYGCVDGSEKLDLQPVHRLKTRIIQIREVPSGTSIGYGADCPVGKASKIATIPLGYADGIPTQLGNGQLKVLVKGQQASSIGRICMDMSMIDITDLENIMIGDEVEVFGENLSLVDFARSAGTIPYEILVRINQRVERIFSHR